MSHVFFGGVWAYLQVLSAARLRKASGGGLLRRWVVVPGAGGGGRVLGFPPSPEAGGPCPTPHPGRPAPPPTPDGPARPTPRWRRREGGTLADARGHRRQRSHAKHAGFPSRRPELPPYLQIAAALAKGEGTVRRLFMVLARVGMSHASARWSIVLAHPGRGSYVSKVPCRAGRHEGGFGVMGWHDFSLFEEFWCPTVSAWKGEDQRSGFLAEDYGEFVSENFITTRRWNCVRGKRKS